MSQGITMLVVCGILLGVLIFMQWKLKVDRDK